jgi:hypothetical protein
MDLYLY